MEIEIFTPHEHSYVARQLQLAGEDARVALEAMVPARPAVHADATLVRDSCFEAAEHLYDVLQVDVPADMVEDVGHALEQLHSAINALPAPGMPGAAPPAAQAPTDETLRVAVEQLGALERRLRNPQ